MRQNQQNRRMRGRNNGGSGSGGGNNNNNNNNNRRGPNPLTRSYESNGPDVKVRGTAQHIAEKYLQLARDAHSSGDRVMAENYLQHAEHYNRIIATAMAQQQAQRESREIEEDDDLTDNSDNRFADNPITMRQQEQQEQQDQPNQQNAPVNNHNQPQVSVYDGDQPQPVIEAMAPVDGGMQPVARENNRPPREPRVPRENDGERAAPRNTRRERGPRVPREPRVEAVAAVSDVPEEGGLLATLSRGADKPVPVTADE
jgi:Domain of unknown function (DUF4167)